MYSQGLDRTGTTRFSTAQLHRERVTRHWETAPAARNGSGRQKTAFLKSELFDSLSAANGGASPLTLASVICQCHRGFPRG